MHSLAVPSPFPRRSLARYLPAREPAAYSGQPVAIVLATSAADAARAARLVRLVPPESKAAEPAFATDAGKAPDFPGHGPQTSCNGSPEEIDALLAAAQSADDQVYAKERFTKRSQAHFYLETQRTLAIPDEDGTLLLYTSVSVPRPDAPASRAASVRLTRSEPARLQARQQQCAAARCGCEQLMCTHRPRT